MAPVSCIKEDENDDFEMDPSVFDENVSIYKGDNITLRKRQNGRPNCSRVQGVRTNSSKVRDLAARKEINLL